MRSGEVKYRRPGGGLGKRRGICFRKNQWNGPEELSCAHASWHWRNKKNEEKVRNWRKRYGDRLPPVQGRVVRDDPIALQYPTWRKREREREREVKEELRRSPRWRYRWRIPIHQGYFHGHLRLHVTLCSCQKVTPERSNTERLWVYIGRK